MVRRVTAAPNSHHDQVAIGDPTVNGTELSCARPSCEAIVVMASTRREREGERERLILCGVCVCVCVCASLCVCVTEERRNQQAARTCIELGRDHANHRRVAHLAWEVPAVHSCAPETSFRSVSP